jgi:predicted Rossmann fold nucleotide-binding protein DprA/Smf involved in DNA uptake
MVVFSMKRVAIIGTRQPTADQIGFINQFLSKLDPEKVEVISGCCEGVDDIALTMAKTRGFKTIGVVPWRKYNPHIQAKCDVIISDRDVDLETRLAAKESVFKYHPNPHACSDGAILLHSRNYLIVFKSDVTLACPKNMTGGTMQGVRICVDKGIQLVVVKEDGTEADRSEYT